MKPDDSKDAVGFRKTTLEHPLKIRNLAKTPGFMGVSVQIPHLEKDFNWGDYIRSFQNACNSSDHCWIKCVFLICPDCNLLHFLFKSERSKSAAPVLASTEFAWLGDFLNITRNQDTALDSFQLFRRPLDKLHQPLFASLSFLF